MAEASQIALPLLELINVGMTYQEGMVQALQGVSLAIEAGEFVSIVGKSGCGKSTLLHVMGALDRPTTGQVLFRRQQLQSLNLDQVRARHFGFVFQSFYLLPNLTALENVQIPLMMTEPDARTRVRRSQELLQAVGLADRQKHLPSQLSIGQRQRVAIARALSNRPEIVFADEPTGSLDSQSSQEVMELLLQLREQQGTTLVMVTHDNGLAALGSRQIRLHDGKIVQTASSAG